ncbi:MAG: tRNA (adenosine(37)-N6)-threonylcarbamoyltransferase complex ATPase subunit type 1 TsaE [Mariprofundaceae bacterium]
MQTRLNSEEETCAFAASFANKLKPGDIVALSGELGAGKSVFARALMRALGVTDTAMPSPTFAIIQEYEGRDCRVAHMDWYRLEGEGELEAIGIREYFQPPWIVIIEWPERAASLVNKQAHRISLSVVADNPDARLIEITSV